MKKRCFEKDEETLCWQCANYSRCSWADGVPVEGWEATPTVVRDYDGDFKSYLVRKCPLFKPDAKREITTKEIAAILGVSRDTVFHILRREGEARLQRRMKRKGYKLSIWEVPTKSGDRREFFIEKIKEGGDK